MDYEKLGVFYLGQPVDPATREPTGAPLLYPSRQLTTHAVVLGMTGSGKTGLSLALLEEAALDGVPAICIDPKGDLGNLMLTFPELAPADFEPWVDAEEAARRGVGAAELAAQAAGTWRKGLADSGQDAARIARLRAAAEVTIYTPGSSAGVPLALLRSFDAPAGDLDEEALRERVAAAVSGLLGLLGVDADPLQSRDHILVSRLLHDAWVERRDVDLAALILGIQKPPFDRVGVMDLESFFPAKERAGLAMALNNLLASPGAQAWMQGEPLDIARLLTAPDGRPRLSIVSIAHLGDAQRMFFVATLLAELVAWMRTQTGTSSLRALCFMDEIFGYFPPTANPPSKGPMLTLLKQARAFGLGMVVATQNPVDLDYKGLANCGTWFIGRLQAERDKLRVLDGLEGASAAGGRSMDRAAMDTLLSSLGNRVFLLHNVHADAPVLFQTRWTLSYLRGPITREEIRRLTAGSRAAGAKAAGARPAEAAPTAPPAARTPAPRGRPAVPVAMEELFLGEGDTYEPHVYAVAKVHYVDARRGVDVWEEVGVLAPLRDDDRRVDWAAAASVDPRAFGKAPTVDAAYVDLPDHVGQKAALADWRRSFAAWVYQARPATLSTCARLGVTSRPGEAEAAFRARLAFAVRETRDAEVQAMRKKFEPKVQALDEKVRRAQARLTKEEADAQAATVDTVASWGNAIFGGLFGRGSAVSKLSTAAKKTGRGMSARSDVQAAELALAGAPRARAELAQELTTHLARIAADSDPATLPLEEVRVPARKADTQVVRTVLVWRARG